MRSLGRRSKDKPGLGGKKGEEFEGDYMDGMGIHLVGTMGSSFFLSYLLSFGWVLRDLGEGRAMILLALGLLDFFTLESFLLFSLLCFRLPYGSSTPYFPRPTGWLPCFALNLESSVSRCVV
jgi:hypothetical protein